MRFVLQEERQRVQRDHMRGLFAAIDRRSISDHALRGMRDDFDNLDVAGRGVAIAARNARFGVYALLILGVLLAWFLLGLMAIGAAGALPPGTIGPGDWILRKFPDWPLPAPLAAFVGYCLSPAVTAWTAASSLAALTAMWGLMSVAMMLPSAAPLVRTYCEIADTAAVKGERAVHPLVLVSGYLAVWAVASLCFAALTIAFQWPANVGGSPPTRHFAIAGAVLILAGLYQFSGLKEACLKKCRNPFSILFARWTTSRRGIFRLGAEQGLWCLGCCWALMLVMFAVGVMNVFWMALIAVFATVEKQSSSRLPSIASGAILLVWGAALLVMSA
jgi:predicted metal-binding membrane protein